MEGATDTRIVQMQFDNKNFERNVKTSQRTIEKFKKHLNFDKCEKGLDNLQAAASKISFANFADNIEKLANKFTGLGTVSELVLSQIRRGIESAARSISGLVNELTFKQIDEGKKKFESMTKSVQTIKAATGEAEETVYKYLGRLNRYTDQTSYDFADMAANIGKFTSVGVSLKDAEKEMEGIANWAARSGAGIEEASRAMYNLSQAMGIGKLTTVDWKSIENANMATKEFKKQLIEAGLAMGTLTIDNKGVIKTAAKLGKQVVVTENNLRETLNKGWVNRQVLERGLLSYYYDDLTYENEKLFNIVESDMEENEKKLKDYKLDARDWLDLKGVGEVTNETKKQLMDLAVAYGRLTKRVDAQGNEIYEVTDKNGKKVKVTVDNFVKSLDYGWLDSTIAGRAGIIKDLGEESYKAAQKCLSLTDVFKAWKDQLSTGWMNFWKHLFGELSEAMETFSNICNKVGDSFSNFMRVFVGDGENFLGIMGEFARQGGRASLWSMFIGEYDGMYEGAYGLLDVIHDIAGMIKDAFWEIIYVMNPEIGGAGSSKEDWMANETYRVYYLGRAMREGLEKVKQFIQGIKDFFSAVPEGQTKSRFQQIQDVVTGVGSAAAIVYQTVKDIIEFVGILLDQNHLGPVVDDIIEIFSMIGREITKTAGEAAEGKGLISFLRQFVELFSQSAPLGKAIAKLSESIKKLIGYIIGADSEASSTISIWQSVSSALMKIAKVVAKVAAPIIDFLADFIDAARKLFSGEIDFAAFAQNMKTALKNALNSVFSFTPDFVGSVKDIWGSIKRAFESGFSASSIDELKQKIKTLFQSFKASIPANVKNSIKTIYNNIKTFAQNTYKKIKDAISPFFQDIKNVFSSGFSPQSISQLKARFSALFQSIGDHIPEGLKKGFSGVVEKVKTFFVDKWHQIFFTFESGYKDGRLQSWYQPKTFSAIFQSISNAIPQGVKDAFGGVVDKVKDFFVNLWNNLKNKIFGIFRGNNGGQNVANGMVNALAGNDDPLNSQETIFDKIMKWLKAGWQRLKDWVKGLFGGGSANNADSPLGMVQGYVARLSGGKKPPKALGYIAKNGASDVGGGKSFVQKLQDSVIGDPDKLEGENIFDKIIKWFEDGFAKIRGFVQRLVGNEEGDEASLATWVQNNVDLTTVALVIVGALGIVGVFKLIKKIKNAVESLLNLAQSVADIPKNINEALHGKEKPKDIGDKMLKIAAALAIVVAAIYVLGQMKAEDAWRGIAIVLLIMAGLTACIIALKLFFKKNDMTQNRLKAIDKFILMFLGIAVSVAILVNALKPLAGTDWGDLGKMGAGLVVCLGALLAVAFLLRKTKNNKFDPKAMASLLAVAASVYILVQALLVFKDIDKPEQWIRMFGGLTGVLGSIIGFIFLVNMASKLGKNAMKDIWQLAALIGAISILVFALMPLTVLNLAQLANMVGFLGVVLLELAGFVMLVSLASKWGSMSKSAMGQLAAVAAAVAILVFALIPVAMLNSNQVDQMILTLTKILGLLAAFVAVYVVINKFSKGGSMKDSGMAQLAAVAGAVAILVLAMIPLALLRPEQLTQAILAVGALLLELGGFIVLVTKLGNNSGSLKGSGMAQLLAVVGAVVILVLAMIPLALMPFGQLAQAVGAVAIILLSLAAVVLTMSKLQTGKKAITNILMMVMLAGIIVVFGETLKQVKDIKWEQMVGFAAAIAVLMLAMAAVMLILSKIQNPVAMIAAMLIFVVGFAAVLGVIILMLPLLMEAIGKGMVAMMSHLVLVAGMFGDTVEGFNGVSEGDLTAAKKKFEILMEIIWMLKDSSSYLTAINDFEKCMLKLGNAIDTFVFVTKDISEGPETNKGVAFVEKILSLQDQFSTFTTGSFSDELSTLGGALSTFMTLTEGVSEEPMAFKLLKGLADQADNLDRLSKLPLQELKDNIAGLGGALAIYAVGASEATGLETDDLPDIQKAVEVMQTVMASLNGEDGEFVLPNLPTETNLTDFGTQLAALAGALITFSNASKELNDDDVKKATSLLDFLSTLRSKLIADNVMVALVFKEAKVSQYALSSFGNEIAALGGSMKSFTDSTKDFVMNDNVEAALTFFQGLRDKLNTTNLEFVDEFLGMGFEEKTLTEFGNEIGELGVSLKKFADNVNFEEGTKKNFNDAIGALDDIISLGTRLPKLGGVKGWLEGNVQTLGSISTDIVTLGSALRDISNALEGNDTYKKFDAELVKDAMSSIESFAVIATTFGADIDFDMQDAFADLNTLAVWVDSFIDKAYLDPTNPNNQKQETIIDKIIRVMEEFATKSKLAEGLMSNVSVFESFKNFANAIASLAAVDPSMDFSKVGAGITNGIVLGLETGENAVYLKVQEIVREAVKKAKEESGEASPSKVFAQIGKYLSIGLAQGIEKKANEPVAAAQLMMKTAIDAVKEAAKVKSPSRVFAEIGNYLGLGLSAGLKDSVKVVTNTSEFVAKSLIDTMREALGIHSPSTEAMELATFVGKGFIKGLEKMEPKIADAWDHSLDIDPFEHEKRMQKQAEEKWAYTDVDPFEHERRMIEESQKSLAAEEKNLKKSNRMSPWLSWMLDLVSPEQMMGTAFDLAKNLKYARASFTGAIKKAFVGLHDEAESVVSKESDKTMNIIAIGGNLLLDKLSAKASGNKNDEGALGVVKNVYTNVIGSVASVFANPQVEKEAEKTLLDGIGSNTSLVEMPFKIFSNVLDMWTDHEDVDTKAVKQQALAFTSSYAQVFGDAFGDKAPQIEKAANNVLSLITPSIDGALADDYEPVISPVLDLTNIQNNAGAIRDYLNANGLLSLNGGTVTIDPSAAMLNANVSMPENTTKPMNDIREEIADLRGDMQTFAQAVTNMKFVMNTGALVGAIGPEMDEYLGLQGYYAARAEIP